MTDILLLSVKILLMQIFTNIFLLLVRDCAIIIVREKEDGVQNRRRSGRVQINTAKEGAMLKLSSGNGGVLYIVFNEITREMKLRYYSKCLCHALNYFNQLFSTSAFPQTAYKKAYDLLY